MTFAEIQELFMEATGRRDLSGLSGALSIENLIDGGKRLLDDRYGAPDSRKSYVVAFDPGDYLVTGIQLLRVPEYVWATTSTMRSVMDHKTAEWMRLHFSATPSTVAPGVPTYFAMLPSLSPQLTDLTGINYDNWDVLVNNTEGNAGIIVMPPANSYMDIRIDGLFYSARLVEAADTNFWATCYPHELVTAAKIYHEMLYTSGARALNKLTVLDELLRGFVYNQNDVVDIRLRG